MAFFDGLDIFGPHVRIESIQNPKARQLNHYPGTSGLEGIDMGNAGGFSTAEGFLGGFTPYDLSAAENVFRAYQSSGRKTVLVDTLGGVWRDVVLETFRPEGEVLAGFSTRLGRGWFRFYRALFLHFT